VKDKKLSDPKKCGKCLQELLSKYHSKFKHKSSRERRDSFSGNFAGLKTIPVTEAEIIIIHLLKAEN
jgi:hypothetical protein